MTAGDVAFDPAAWLTNADMVGYAPWLVTQPDGSTGLCTCKSPPPADRSLADALNYAINPNNPNGNANFQALVNYMDQVGRSIGGAS